jgi:putative intracellular protease/amidase
MATVIGSAGGDRVKWRYVGWASAAVVMLGLAGFGIWIASLPAAAATSPAPAIPAHETAAMLSALAPPKRPRPLIAVVGLNDATETTDYLMPTGILRRADVADVITLAPAPGPVTLYPALTVLPDATLADFDARHPGGADYVIVPAMSRDDDPRVVGWLRAQASRGATVVSVCAGAKVAAAAGLLDGRRATTHWYYLPQLLGRHPTIRYVPDRRLVVDGRVATTTGITASMPMMLTLVEAIGGRAKAEAVAADLGLETWDARHASGAFALTRRFALTVLANRLAFWNREEFGLELRPGADEVSLALVADAWSRTYRSRALTVASGEDPVTTRHGILVVPDRVSAGWRGAERLPLERGRPVEALRRALEDIGSRYGGRTAGVVAMQLEYPEPISPRALTASILRAPCRLRPSSCDRAPRLPSC